MLAPLTVLTHSVESYALLVRLLGLALHAAAAATFAFALATRTGDGGDARPRLGQACAAGLLVALHPDLIAAAMSGMEVALAELCVAAMLITAPRNNRAVHALLALVAFLARPELAVIAILLPALASASRGPRAAIRAAIAPLGGAILGLGASMLRNLSVSGLPLPATFYAKVGHGPFGVAESILVGFTGLMNKIVVADSGLLLLTAMGVSWLALREKGRTVTLAHAAVIAGLVFVTVSFMLIPPIDADAFYHQRYVLPGVALFLAGVPGIVQELVGRLERRTRRGAILAAASLAVLTYSTAFTPRMVHLENDCHNIDDIQVRLGKRLGALGKGVVVWTIDAGAVRYFAKGDVVDLIGLNTPELLTDERSSFLARHAPTHIVLMSGFDALVSSSEKLSAVAISPSTPYTVTGFKPMATQYLVTCPPGVSGVLMVRGVPTPFTCRTEGPPAEGLGGRHRSDR